MFNFKYIMFGPEDLRTLAEAFFYPENGGFLSLISPLKALSKKMGLNFGGEFEVQDLEGLKVEYTRLFITSPYYTPAPPYASVYLSSDRRLKGEGYDQALAFYREAGYEPVEEGELADHVAYELAFMALLLEENRKDLLRVFLEDHFLKWYPRFLSALKQVEPHPFYRALGELVSVVSNRLREEVLHEEKRFS